MLLYCIAGVPGGRESATPCREDSVQFLRKLLDGLTFQDLLQKVPIVEMILQLCFKRSKFYTQDMRQTMRLLMDLRGLGLDLHATDIEGYAPLWYVLGPTARSRNHSSPSLDSRLSCISILLLTGNDPRQTDLNGRIALHMLFICAKHLNYNPKAWRQFGKFMYFVAEAMILLCLGSRDLYREDR